MPRAIALSPDCAGRLVRITADNVHWAFDDPAYIKIYRQYVGRRNEVFDVDLDNFNPAYTFEIRPDRNMRQELDYPFSSLGTAVLVVDGHVLMTITWRPEHGNEKAWVIDTSSAESYETEEVL